MLVCLFLSLFTQAQKITLTGKITDDKGQPVSGASVRILSSAAGTSSNTEGLFSLNVNGNDILTVSHTGYATQEVPVNGRASLVITLQQTSVEMQTVMVGTRRAGRVKNGNDRTGRHRQRQRRVTADGAHGPDLHYQLCRPFA